MTRQIGRWSAASGVVCAVLVLSLVTTLAFRVTHHLRYSHGQIMANIYGHWALLLASLLTGAAAVASGIAALRSPGGANRQLGLAGLVLGVLALGALAIWELSGWWFALFWDI